MRETPWHREDPVDALERAEQRIADTMRWSDCTREEAEVPLRTTPHFVPPVELPCDHFADEMDDVTERQAARDRRAVND